MSPAPGTAPGSSRGSRLWFGSSGDDAESVAAVAMPPPTAEACPRVGWNSMRYRIATRPPNPTSEIAARMSTLALDVAGRTSLGALGALVAGAELVVCNDTSISHLAAAFELDPQRIPTRTRGRCVEHQFGWDDGLRVVM